MATAAVIKQPPTTKITRPDAPRVMTLAIKGIKVPDANPRLKGCETKEELDALAASIASAGLLQPIGVRADGDAWELVWGSRRLQACRQIGLETIDAIAFDGTDAQAAEARAIENLHRRAMNPLEELLAVESLMNTPATSGVRSRETAVKETAERMGRSTSWVRDRLYFARLGDKARKMLAAGEMTAPLARELAKVVDHGQQEEIIRQEFRNTADEGLPGLGYLREICNRRALSLHQVPWNLEAKVGDTAAPACTACPHNTDNDKTLFEHDGKKVELGETKRDPVTYREIPLQGPFCTNAGCYETKQKACEKEIDAAIKKAEKVARTEAAEDRPKGKKAKDAAPAKPVQIEFEDVDADHVPDFVNMDALEERIDKHNVEAQRAGAPTKKEMSEAERDRKWKEAKQRRKEKDAAKKKIRKERLDALRRVPGALATIALLAKARDEDLHKVFGRCVSWSKAGGRDNHQLTPAGKKFFDAIVSESIGLEPADLDRLVESVSDPKYGEAPWEKFVARLGQHARPYFEHAVFGVPMPELKAPAKAKAKKGGRR